MQVRGCGLKGSRRGCAPAKCSAVWSGVSPRPQCALTSTPRTTSSLETSTASPAAAARPSAARITSRGNCGSSGRAYCGSRATPGTTPGTTPPLPGRAGDGGRLIGGRGCSQPGHLVCRHRRSEKLLLSNQACSRCKPALRCLAKKAALSSSVASTASAPSASASTRPPPVGAPAS